MLLRRFRGQGGAPRMLNIAFRLQRFQLGRKKGMRRRWVTVPKIFLKDWIFDLSGSNRQ